MVKFGIKKVKRLTIWDGGSSISREVHLVLEVLHIDVAEHDHEHWLFSKSPIDNMHKRKGTRSHAMLIIRTY